MLTAKHVCQGDNLRIVPLARRPDARAALRFLLSLEDGSASAAVAYENYLRAHRRKLLESLHDRIRDGR